jgi:hypothetical protein
MKNHILAGLVLTAGLAFGADASTVRFKFAGTITEVSGIPGPVQVGNDFTIAYHFDSETPDTEPAPNFGSYEGAINFVEGNVGSHIVNFDFGTISVLNDGFAGDTYGANMSNPISLMAISLTDFGFGAFSNDSLPVDLDFRVFDATNFSIHVDVGPAFWEATGTVTAFSSEILPEPCYPDCNGVGGLTIADFGCFQTRFVAGDPYADCNGVGGLTIADFACFQTAFVAGCP